MILYLSIFLFLVSVKKIDVTELQKASSAADCFLILQNGNIFTPTDVMAMQFFLHEIECKELETECVEYAKKHEAMYYHEKSPGNTFRNVKKMDNNMQDYALILNDC